MPLWPTPPPPPTSLVMSCLSNSSAVWKHMLYSPVFWIVLLCLQACSIFGLVLALHSMSFAEINKWITDLCIGACRPGHTQALPGLFSVLISQGPDAKTRGMLRPLYIYHTRAYARTDIRIAYSVVTNYATIAHQIWRSKVLPGTHTALQAPMDLCNITYMWSWLILRCHEQ